MSLLVDIILDLAICLGVLALLLILIILITGDRK